MSTRFNPYRNFVGSFIPNSLMAYPHLTASAKLLWARLAQYAGQNGECYPSQSRLAKDLGVSDRYIRKLIDELVKKGFLEVEHPKAIDRPQGKSSRYYFLKHEIFNDSNHRNSCSGDTGTVVPETQEQLFRKHRNNSSAKENIKEEKKENCFSDPVSREKAKEYIRMVRHSLNSGPVISKSQRQRAYESKELYPLQP